jgi:hypothetical protein
MLPLRIALAFCLIAVATRADEVPVPSAGGGGMLPLDSGPYGFWEDTPNFDGLLGSSERIPDIDLASELANDFLFEPDLTVLCWKWWGGYFAFVPGDPLVESFTLRVYADQDGLPGVLLIETVVSSDANEAYCYDQGGIPIYEYVHLIEVDFDPGHYWLSVQARDHLFPPQWGRLAAAWVEQRPAVFKSPHFAYPDWVPAETVFGEAYDASVRLDGYVPVMETSWGAIKGLYR